MKMKFKFPFFKKERPEYFLALDIGTEAVKALMCSDFALSSTKTGQQENKKIIIHGAALEYFDRSGVFDTKDFEVEILKKAIFKTIKEIQAETKVKTDKLFLGLPANILRGRVVSQNFKRENQKEIITEAEKNQIHQTVFNEVKKKLSQKFAQKLGIFPEDFYFSNLKILEIKIDGYEVSALQGLSGENLDFEVLVIFSPKYYLEKIKRICQGFNLKIFKTVHPVENLSSFFKEEKDAIFFDIGGEWTKIFLLERGKLTAISEFKKGGTDFTRKLSQILGTSFPMARVLKHDYSQSHLSKQMRRRVREILSDDTQNWFEILKKNLRIFSKKLLPSNIFLFGGGGLLPETPEILEKGNWRDFSFVVRPEVKFIYPKDLKNIENKTKGLNSPQQIPLLLISYG